MKEFLTILISWIICVFSFGQVSIDQSYKMTRHDNFEWLKKVSTLDDKSQFESVRQRLFINLELTQSNPKLETPILVIDGFLITDTIGFETKNFLINRLTSENTNITIVEDEPGEAIWCKPFTGIVSLTIIDKETRKEFEKLK